jgi:ketosteroid isomerase-like protein
LFQSPEEAQQAFYQAFEQGDLEAMMRVWDMADDILCVHPMAPALHGREAVSHGWREIFTGGVDMRFTIVPVQRYAQEDLAVLVVDEVITVGSGKRVAPMVATNIYRRGADGWRMLTHHAGPAPSPEAADSNQALH